MEQVLRELRSIVFQGRDSGKPVVVQPAETDYQLQELTRRIADLEQALTRVNGQLETTNHDLQLAKRDAEALRRDNKALADRLGGMEQRQAAPTSDARSLISPGDQPLRPRPRRPPPRPSPPPAN